MGLPNHGLERRTEEDRASEPAQPVLLHGPAAGGIHSHLFECGDLTTRFDAARRDDRVRRCVAQPAKPFEVCARHRAFAVHVGAQKATAERLELRHHFFRLKPDARAPAVNGYVSPGSVESDDNSFSTNFFCEPPQESTVHFSLTESGASNNNLASAPSGNFFGTRNGSNPAPDAHLHAEDRK